MSRILLPILALIAACVPAIAQHSASEPVPYCADLKQVANLAMTQERFASITGAPQEGNFSQTTLPLEGWRHCAIYGRTTYTCDSQPLETAEKARTAEATIAGQVLACLGDSWAEIKDQSSPGYLVLHPALGPASITFNLDATETKEHVVRLTLFIRRR